MSLAVETLQNGVPLGQILLLAMETPLNGLRDSLEPVGAALCPRPGVPMSHLSTGGGEEPAAPPEPSPGPLRTPHLTPNATEGAQEPALPPHPGGVVPPPPRSPFLRPLPWLGLGPAALSHSSWLVPVAVPKLG